MKTITFVVGGMHCGGCKLAVEKELGKIPWIQSSTADLRTGTCVLIFDEESNPTISEKVLRTTLETAVKNAGYTIHSWHQKKTTTTTPLLWFSLLFLFGLVLIFSPITLPAIGEISENIGFLALFGLGLTTSIHCIGMCGGINLSVTLTTKGEAWRSSLYYNGGRVIGYTLVGGILGAIGGVFNLSAFTKGSIAILAGLLMFAMALKQLGIAKDFNLPSLLPKAFSKLPTYPRVGQYTPLLVGIANSLMPCGPLQAMQLYALATGSIWRGALGMFIFALGTVPLMYSFGLSAASLGKRFSKQLKQASALLLIALALISIQRGLLLTNGTSPSIRLTETPPTQTAEPLKGSIATLTGDGQYVKVSVTPYGYEDIVLQVGIPATITFVAEGTSLNSCNEAIMIPEFNIKAGLHVGETIITFTPEQIGSFDYSCWMGMIGNVIHVVDVLP